MNATQRTSVLPPTLPPIGINLEQAAAFVGIGVPLFNKMIAAGTMPAPRVAGGRLVYDVQEVIEAFRRLPHKNEDAAPLDEAGGSGNPWD